MDTFMALFNYFILKIHSGNNVLRNKLYIVIKLVIPKPLTKRYFS